MNGRNRPDGQSQAVSQALAGATQNLPVELAHLFGVGVSQAELHRLNRRGLASLGEAMPAFWKQIALRFIEQLVIESLPAYWVRRAEYFETCASPSADEAARLCRIKAWVLAEALRDDVEVLSA